ncbi:DUF4058 family protein [Oscillochloris sp. ZM17-4]|uniref:DUF4058 family protein n=1 Tax=Oscillochloris sp. ZM17-4 TaxID=2866714 RepID=UPI001C72AFC8|nr:DUF4058 family protein [Oscillochloris sp. ZM17-4]MBX0326092.1 DUF4058 family protein [Oscillochloris sp. ZM17-4]
MELPFPGMDPYLERPSLWPDVHNSLIYAMREQIQRQFSPRYKAVITPYISLESLEIVPNRRVIVPDVGIIDRGEPGDEPRALAIAPAPLTMTAIMEIPIRLARVEIRVIDDETLVTAIELLSPANKRPGPEGADAYERKRQELFRSEAHLLEIDLLRGGQRPRLSQPLPANPYFVLLSRAYNRPYVEIWPLALREPIAPVPVPLSPPDPDIPLDLGVALRQIYASARYDLQIDYGFAPPAPDLSPEDAAWLDAHLRARGLR